MLSAIGQGRRLQQVMGYHHVLGSCAGRENVGGFCKTCLVQGHRLPSFLTRSGT